MTTIKGTVTVLLVATAYVSPSLSQTVTVSKAQLAKDMWVANAKYNIDTSGNYQLVAIAAGLHSAFAADPGLTAAQGQSIIHDTMNQLNSWRSAQATTPTPTELYQKTLTLMADVTTSSSVKAAAGISKDLLAFVPQSTPENDWKNINAFQYAEFSVDRGRESQILESVYDDAHSSASMQIALDQGIGPQIKGLTTESAETLLDHNPGLGVRLGMQGLNDLVKGEGDSIQLSVADIKGDLNAQLGDLTNVVKEDTSLLSKMNEQQADIKAYLSDAAAQEHAAQLAQHQQQLDQLRIEAADAAFQVFGKIIGGQTGSQVAATIESLKFCRSW